MILLPEALLHTATIRENKILTKGNRNNNYEGKQRLLSFFRKRLEETLEQTDKPIKLFIDARLRLWWDHLKMG
ncbi:MAG TPA: hypothetical protein VK072_09220 [Candidatus Avamphibacillus sp.]|nr:hypothetical protein [Candidatus Avamphibacillus sp.]